MLALEHTASVIFNEHGCNGDSQQFHDEAVDSTWRHNDKAQLQILWALVLKQLLWKSPIDCTKSAAHNVYHRADSRSQRYWTFTYPSRN